MGKSEPTHGHALEDLRGLLEEIAHSGPRRLPSVRALAHRWRLSLLAVQRVLAEARRRGWIETRNRSGSWPTGQIPHPQRPASRRTAADCAALLREEIESGRWPSGEALPGPKALAARCGVHVATIRKALEGLRRAAVISRVGRVWSVARPRRKAGFAPTLLCIGAPDPQGGLRMDLDREWEFWREIKSEAIRYGLATEVLPWTGRFPEGDIRSVGAIVSTWHMGEPKNLLRALHARRLFASVWLENPDLAAGDPRKEFPLVGWHDLSYNREAGMRVAEHPAIRRHRRIAWIGPFHAAEWSRNRLEGLRESLPGGVRVHAAVGPWKSEWDLQEAVWKEKRSWPGKDVAQVLAGPGGVDLVRPLMEAIAYQRLFKMFEKELRAALESGATLWVGSSDKVALQAMDWLGRRGLRVPRDMSLMGFDDSREAHRAGLTSYRFDTPAMARAMVRQVLLGRAGARRVHRYDGTLLLRPSTPMDADGGVAGQRV